MMEPTDIKVEGPEIKILRKTAGKITPRDVIKRFKELQRDRIQNIRPGKSIKLISLADIYESFGFEYDEKSRKTLEKVKLRNR